MKKSASIIGVGAFGEFAIPHLVPYFHLNLYDEFRDLQNLKTIYGDEITLCDFSMAATSDIVILAVPIQSMESVIKALAPLLRSGQLVLDVGSVKCKPVEILTRYVDPAVDVVATHPIFGPQSGKNGIKGQNIAVVNVQGERESDVVCFLRDSLGLNVIQCSADDHDKQMAYVQGLTHMIAKIFKNMDVPEISQASKTYTLLQDMVNLIKNDSDDLFRAIQTDNPYVSAVKTRFFESVKALETRLKE